MKKLKKFIETIKENLSSISTNTLLQFISGVLITELVFGLLSIHSTLHYGVGVLSVVLCTFGASIAYHFELKRIFRFAFGSIIAFLLILLMTL